MICNNCQKEIDKDSKFCQFCGEKVEEIERAVAIVDVEKEMLDHLEFLGYELNDLGENGNAKRYLAKHKSKYNLIFNAVKNIGVSFISLWGIDPKKVEKNKLEAFEIVNRMNSRALFCSFWITTDLSSYGAGGLYLGKYDKKLFADFLDLLENDIQGRFREEEFLKKIT